MLKSWQIRTLQANLVAQSAIVVTGAIVRVTSSGLGCPTWPECVPGSITPTSDQVESWHKYIEFGNRLLTIALVLVAIATIAAMWSQHRTLRQLSWGSLLGIFAQAVIGGISVLTGLNPLVVASHFLLSIGLIAVAMKLYWNARYGFAQRELVTAVPLVLAIKAHTWLALLIIVIGTLVTGTGPHAGDSADIVRLGFDPQIISWIHADVVLLFVGLTTGLIIALAATRSPTALRRAAMWVLIVSLAQGLIGYLQYFNGLPWLLVASHVLGAVILWFTSLRLRLSIV